MLVVIDGAATAGCDGDKLMAAAAADDDDDDDAAAAARRPKHRKDSFMIHPSYAGSRKNRSGLEYTSLE